MADQWVEGHELVPVGSGETAAWVEGHQLGKPAPKAKEGPSKLEAVARGAGQGWTQGYSDEAIGGLGTVLLKAIKGGDAALSGLGLKERARYLDQVSGDTGALYRELRDKERAANTAAKSAHPYLYGGSEFGGAVASSVVPGLGAAKGGAAAATLRGLLSTPKGAGLVASALRGGVGGGLMALGNSEADLTRGDIVGAATDTGAGFGIGAAFGGAGSKLGRFGGKAADEVRMANADAAQAMAMKTQKAARAAGGAYGGEVASVLDVAKSAEHALASPMATAEQKAAAQAKLADPDFVALYRNALDGKLELSTEKMGGRLLSARAAHETAKAASTPEAIEAAAAETMKNPIRNQVLPRLKTYAERIAPIAIGHQLGGWPGVAAGAAMAGVMGKPGTAWANMVKHPATRAALWTALGSGARGLEPAARYAPATAALEMSPMLAARIAALRGTNEPNQTPAEYEP